MNQQPSQDNSLSARLQLRGREALETALQEADPLSCGLIAASADMLNLARRLQVVLERCMNQDDASVDELERLSPFISQFLQLNRVGASMLHLRSRLSK
jgi:hypothetical protein